MPQYATSVNVSLLRGSAFLNLEKSSMRPGGIRAKVKILMMDTAGQPVFAFGPLILNFCPTSGILHNGCGDAPASVCR